MTWQQPLVVDAELLNGGLHKRRSICADLLRVDDETQVVLAAHKWVGGQQARTNQLVVHPREVRIHHVRDFYGGGSGCIHLHKVAHAFVNQPAVHQNVGRFHHHVAALSSRAGPP